MQVGPSPCDIGYFWLVKENLLIPIIFNRPHLTDLFHSWIWSQASLSSSAPLTSSLPFMSISMLQATVFKLNVLPKLFLWRGEENYFVSVCDDSCPFLRDLSVWNEHQKRNDEKRDWKKIFSFNHIQSSFLMAYYFFLVGRASRYMWIH